MFLPIIVIPFALFGPFLVCLGSVWADMDPTYYTLELLLSNPLYRTSKEIYGALGFRIILNLMVSLEIIRSLTFFGCTVYIVLERFIGILETLLTTVREFGSVYRYYVTLILLYKKLENMIHFLLHMILTMSFWALVACCWICVKANIDQITIPFYMMFVMIAAMIAVLKLIVVPMICNSMQAAELVVKFHFMLAKLRYARLKGFINKERVMKLKAIKPIQMKYGPFWALDRKFVGEYFWLIVLRIFDTILLLDF